MSNSTNKEAVKSQGDQAAQAKLTGASAITAANPLLINSAIEGGWFTKYMEGDDCIQFWKYNSAKEREANDTGTRTLFQLTEKELRHGGSAIKLDLYDGPVQDLLDTELFKEAADAQHKLIQDAIAKSLAAAKKQ